MSAFFRCDACGTTALGVFDGYRWSPPSRWRTFEVDDWQAHGCTDACMETIKTDPNGHTPTREIKLA